MKAEEFINEKFGVHHNEKSEIPISRVDLKNLLNEFVNKQLKTDHTDNQRKSILNRKGIVKISADLLQIDDERIMKAIFSQFYPIGVELLDFGVICYVGFSQLFRELQYGEKIPEYQISLKKYIENNKEKIIIENCDEF